ncbi:hypothetical protein ACFPH6_47900 [Streptomyces xiangluensis]|uniref:Aldo/keto reductase family protein n=1 Tax=Streptomyces xiangluensis TaxID=2665720 RepID=A0ABV8Z6J9_9ACTN
MPTRVLVPGTSSRSHLRENIAAAELEPPDDAIAELDTIGRPEVGERQATDNPHSQAINPADE